MQQPPGYEIYQNFKPKTDKLSVHASSYSENKDGLEFIVGFYNDGDYPEVVSDVEFSLVQDVTGYANGANFPSRECTSPIIVLPGKVVFKKFLSSFDFSNKVFHLVPNQKNHFKILLNFEVVSRKGGLIDVPLVVGTLDPLNIPVFKGKSEVKFVSIEKNVDFKKATRHISIMSYPVNNKFLLENACSSDI